MGFGRHKVTVEPGQRGATIEFERGGPTATAPIDMAYDRAVDMAALIWVESFMLDIAGLTRREFQEIKSFMYRDFTKQELADLRRH